MNNQCPKCQAKLSEFAFECKQCEWSLVSDITEEPLQASAIDGVETETDLHLKDAMQAVDDGKFKEALVPLNRAINVAPPERLAECYSLRGYLNLKVADFIAAEKDCTEAIERHWTDAQTFAWRAAARGEQKKWRLAFDDLADACRMAGDQRDPYLQLIQSYAKNASQHFREKIKIGAADADLFFDRGWVYLQANDIEKAKRDFLLALQQQPKHPWASLGMARAIHAGRELNKIDLNKIVELCDVAVNGDVACKLLALKLRVRANHQFGRIAKASKDIKQLRGMAGRDAGLIVQCAELKQKLGDHAGAISDYSTALELDPNSHFALEKRGDAYAAIRNHAKAIADYSQFIRLYPDDITARVHRGRSLLAAGQLDAAESDFTRALNIDASCFDAVLGHCKLNLEKRKFDVALTECEKAIRLNNTRPEAFGMLADVYVRLCDYGRAIEEYSRAIQRSSDDESQAMYLYQRGIAHYELGQFDHSLDDLELATDLRPSHSGSWIWRAAACSRMERWSDAITSLEKAIAARPSTAAHYIEMGRPVAKRAIEYFGHQLQRGTATRPPYRERGLAHQFLGDHSNAIKDFTEALANDESDYETLIRRGKSEAKLNNHLQAIDDFTFVIRREPENHQARYHRAACRAAVAQFDQALVDVVKAIKLNANVPRYHVLHGDLLLKEGKQDRAIRAYDRAIRNDATDAHSYVRRGLVHLHSGDFLNAIHDYTRAIELNPANADALLNRGQAYLKSEQMDLALEDFELALTRNAKLAGAYSGRAVVLTSQDRHEYALIWLTKAIHRFESPKDLAEILFARGKVFFQMRRFLPSIVDFTTAVELCEHDPKTQFAARMARGIGWIHAENFDLARADFETNSKLQPMNMTIVSALKWLDDRTRPLPEVLAAPENGVRPSRPPVIGSEIEFSEQHRDWLANAPHDTWVLRTINRSEFGPVHKDTLDKWVCEGRIVAGMKVLRSDWSKWRRAEDVFPVLDAKGIEIFPKIEVEQKSPEANSEN